MANWSYVGTPYAGLQRIRAMIGDTNPDDQIITNHEILAVLEVYTTETKAAAHICRNLSAKFAAEGDISIGAYHFENLKKAAYFEKLSKSFFLEAYGSERPIALAAPSYGGVSKSVRDANEANTDNIQPKFYRSQFEDIGEELSDATD